MSDFEPGVAQPQNKHVVIEIPGSLTSEPTVRGLRILLDATRWAFIADVVEQSEPKYQWQVFDTKRSRIVMEVPAEDVDEIKGQMKQSTTPVHWVLRRRVVGPWEDVN